MKISNDPDRYLPFRQLAPSKRIILDDPQGPFSPQRLKTRGGLFDAIIFRLITQASPILLEGKEVYFGSPDKFHRAIKGQEYAYYCKRGATGQYDRFKNIPHIDRYWEQTAGWEEFISDSNVSFDSLLKWFTGRQGRQKRFPGMGNLVGWLLASDYTCAFLVGHPTAFDVGEIIFGIGAGSKQGLRLLGFDTNSKKACGTAMEAVSAAVHKELTLQERTGLGIDVITIEHALCKYARLYDVFGVVSFIPPVLYTKVWA